MYATPRPSPIQWEGIGTFELKLFTLILHKLFNDVKEKT
jgi:hypothetical protein